MDSGYTFKSMFEERFKKRVFRSKFISAHVPRNRRDCADHPHLYDILWEGAREKCAMPASFMIFSVDRTHASTLFKIDYKFERKGALSDELGMGYYGHNEDRFQNSPRDDQDYHYAARNLILTVKKCWETIREYMKENERSAKDIIDAKLSDYKSKLHHLRVLCDMNDNRVKLPFSRYSRLPCNETLELMADDIGYYAFMERNNPHILEQTSFWYLHKIIWQYPKSNGYLVFHKTKKCYGQVRMYQYRGMKHIKIRWEDCCGKEVRIDGANWVLNPFCGNQVVKTPNILVLCDLAANPVKSKRRITES